MRLAGQSNSRTPLLYILAASHSGSTLLGMLLGSHPEIETVGELKLGSLGHVSEYRCSCRRLLLECPFWAAVRREMARLGLPLEFSRPITDFNSVHSPYVRRLIRPLHRGAVVEALRDAALSCSREWRRHNARAQAANAALARVVCSVAGKRMIVDSSKTGLRLKYLLRNPNLDVKVVRLIRDGRAVALTYVDPATFADATDPALKAGGTGKVERHHRLDMAEAAREWRRSNEEGAVIVARLPRDRWIEVRYEQLCQEPEAQLARIFEFAGVASVDVLSRFRSIEQHVVGNGMRLDTTSAVRLDERWRTTLDAASLRTFNQVAGDLNASFGYA